MSATCKGCGGVADYAFMDGDVICKKCLVVGAKAKPSDYARAMIEMETLRTQNQQQAERIRELEEKLKYSSMAARSEAKRGDELYAENQQLRAALVSAREALEVSERNNPEPGLVTTFSSVISQIDAILSGQPDGPGEEDGPWAEGWKERVGQPVEDPRDKSDCHGPDWTERDKEHLK